MDDVDEDVANEDVADGDVAAEDGVAPGLGTTTVSGPDPIVVGAAVDAGVIGGEPVDAEVVGDGALFALGGDCADVDGVGSVDAAERAGDAAEVDVDGSSVNDTAGPVDAIRVPFGASPPARAAMPTSTIALTTPAPLYTTARRR